MLVLFRCDYFSYLYGYCFSPYLREKKLMSTTTTHIEKLWGKSILSEGFTSIPNILPRIYRKLNITHGELGLILNILTYKHDERNPFPSYATLADNMDCSEKQIQKYTQSLVTKGLLNVQQRMTAYNQFGSNEYDLTPLIEVCLAYLGMVDEPMEPEVSTAVEPQVPTKMTSFKNQTEEDEYITNQADIYIDEFINQAKQHNLPMSVIERILPRIKGYRFSIHVLKQVMDIFIDKYKSGSIASVGAYFATLIKDKQAVSDYNRMSCNATANVPFVPIYGLGYNWLEA